MYRIFSNGIRFKHLSPKRKREVVETLESATYFICQDGAITKESFQKIISSRNVPYKLFGAADKNGDGNVSIGELMDFLIVLTKPM